MVFKTFSELRYNLDLTEQSHVLYCIALTTPRVRDGAATPLTSLGIDRVGFLNSAIRGVPDVSSCGDVRLVLGRANRSTPFTIALASTDDSALVT